ncbi:MAG: hypothetical protein ACO1N0_10945 [Fluviicola sp.]
MKRNFRFFILLLLLFSCSDKQEELKINTSSNEPKGFPFYQQKHPVFTKWNKYYLSRKSGFKNTSFILSTPVKTEFIEGTVYATFDREFDPIYLPYLVYSPNKEQYIDFNSYHWTLVEGEPQFEVDQEINLVDTKKKTVQRIAFCGSEELVEDVYWQDDHTVVLLKQVEGNKPQITIIDLERQISSSFISIYPLDSPSEYSKIRIRKGIK